MKTTIYKIKTAGEHYAKASKHFKNAMLIKLPV